MELGINGLRVLVTAGGSGIGLSIARAFESEGAIVHICDVDERSLADVEASSRITSSKTDVSDRQQVGRLFEEALAQLGGLDVLINNAEISGPTGQIDLIDPDDWDQTIAINITGQFNCARLAVTHLRASTNASIVN